LISTDPGKVIQINFISFDTEEDYDVLVRHIYWYKVAYRES